jgi:pyrroline-5-carboxylate reductase
MGGALLERWLACGLQPSAVTIIDPQPKIAPAGVKAVAAVDAADGEPQVAVLAVKPQQLQAVAPRLAERIGSTTLLISILAGTRHSTLASLLKGHVVRAMPNTPARLGQGTTVLFGGASRDHRAEALMAAAGRIHWIDDETLFDAVTGVSGSGTAYVFRYIEALEAAGVAAGLPPPLAAELALETVTGAAALAATREAPPSALREQVTSPNGTTAAGLAALDGDGALTELLTRTVAAAAARSRELADG